MEVILKENVPGLGKAGTKVKVKDGYARNYLFPRNLAVPVTAQNEKVFEQQQKARALKMEKEKQGSQEIKKKIEALSLTISVLTQEQEKEKLYGSITAAEIAAALKDEGMEIDKNTIELNEPIKALGVYEVPVKLHPEVTATLKVWIVKK